MKNGIRLLSKQDQVAYQGLLLSSFQSTDRFQADPATLVWTSTDDYYPVLGLFDEGRLASMMRMEWISSDKELLIKLDLKKSPFPAQYPMGYLAKAATLPALMGRGFNTVLRYQALKVFEAWKVNFVLGSMAEGSARVRVMKEMGYVFHEKEGLWNGNLKSNKTILIANLQGLEKIKAALQYIEIHFADALLKYSLAFKPESVPMRGRVNMKFPWDF